jgi:FkbM family methyltransferase
MKRFERIVATLKNILLTGRPRKSLANGQDARCSADGERKRQIVIVDIGCRWGFAEKFITDDALFQVFGFDPDIEECSRLSLRYDARSVSVVPIALAGTPGRRTLFVTQEPACSSLLRPDPHLTTTYPALACARLVSTVEVDTTTLDDWAAENDIQHIDYMKIDTQGTELEILTGGARILNSVRCLEVEVEFNPIYLGQPVFSDVDMFLRSQGFVLWKLTNQVHYSRNGAPNQPIGDDAIFYDDRQKIDHAIFGGQLYWANALYIRKSVLDDRNASESTAIRDVRLFCALGMPDVVGHLSPESGEAGL